MADIMFRTAALFLTLTVPALVRAADPPAEQLKVAPRPVEEMKFPPGTVIVVRGDAREGLGRVDAVVLSPDEYRRLLDSIEQLKKQIAPDRPQIPSKCRITGQVELRGQQEVAKVHAVFEFVNSTARSNWFLGLRRAAAVAATLDSGKPPTLQPGAEGLTASIEGVGAHVLTLDLELPVQSRGKIGERAVMLNIPGSPITVIEQFKLPAGVPTARLKPLAPNLPLGIPPSSRTLAANDLLKPNGDWPAVALGTVDGFELAWDSPAPQQPNEPLLSADGDIRIHLGDAGVETAATLLLKSLRGRVVEWKLQTPPGSEIAFPGNAVVPAPTAYAMDAEKSRWIIRSDDGGLETLTVNIVVRQPKGKPIAVGPFSLDGALRQQGTIRIVAPNNLRAKLSRLRSDVGQRELSTEAGAGDVRAELVQAIYGYSQIAPNASPTPFMFVDMEPVHGALRTQLSHRLELTEAGWRLITKIVATPIRSDFDALDLEIPPALQPSVEVGPRELVEKFERIDAASNLWRIRLSRPRQSETTIQLEALYPRAESNLVGPTPPTREAVSLPLPRTLHSIERDGEVLAIVPEGCQLQGALHEWEHDRIGTWTKNLEERAGKPSAIGISMVRPASVDLSWVPLNAIVPVHMTMDLTLGERQATAQAQVTLPPSDSPRRLTLRSAGPIINQARVVSGGSMTRRSTGEWLLSLPASPDREMTAVLAFSWTLEESDEHTGSRQVMAMLWPVTVRDCDTLVRVWATGNQRPVLREGPWDILSPDAVTGHENLPALVLHANGTLAPLTLGLEPTTGLAPAGVIAERVLIQVTPGDGGLYRYLVRFALRRIAATQLDVELPAVVASVGNLEVYLNERRLDQIAVLDGTGSQLAANAGRVIRVPLPTAGSTAELAISYQLSDASRTMLPAGWELNLAPPRLRNSVFVGAVRWQVMLPADNIVLAGDRWLDLDQRWVLKRGLPMPFSARSGVQLDEWLRSGVDRANGDSAEIAAGDNGAIVRQARLGQVMLIAIPRMVWYLACSLAVLVAGGVLMLARRRRWLFWMTLTGLLTASAVAALIWPQAMLTFIAGTPPGLVVLAMMVLVMTWQSRRYRRRVVFMPGFTRTKPSTNKGTGSSQRRLQTATADAPSAS